MGRPATLRVDILTNAKTKGVDQAESSLGRFGGRAKKYGKVAAAGIAVAGTAAVVVGKQVADAASKQQQAYGALDSIYGKSAKRVKNWAATAADSVGLARSEYAQLSSVVGAQLQGMGYEVDKSAKKSNELIGVGADLAATFGGSVSDAVGAVSSLLKGERDPIEKYGVSIKQADVNARLAAMGLDGLTGKAAKQAQAQATLSLLTEQTAKSQGQFAKESNTLAGQQERLSAKFENIKATVGKALLPVLVTLFTWVNDKLLPGSKRLGGFLSKRLGPTFTKVGKWVSGKLVPTLRELFSWFMEKIYPHLKGAFMSVLRGLRSAFAYVQRKISENSSELSTLGRWLGKAYAAAAPVARIVGKVLSGAFRAVGFAIGTAIGFLSGMVSTVQRVIDAVSWLIDKLGDLKDFAGSGLSKVAGMFGIGSGSVAVHDMRSPTTSWRTGYGMSPGLALGSLSTASEHGSDPLGLGPTSPAMGVYTDARDFSVDVKVDGALDAPAVARQLDRILRQHAQRMGSAPTFARPA